MKYTQCTQEAPRNSGKTKQNKQTTKVPIEGFLCFNFNLVSTFISRFETTIPRVPWWLPHGSINLWASWRFIFFFSICCFFFYLWEEKDSKIKRFVLRLHNSEKQQQRATLRSGNPTEEQNNRDKKGSGEKEVDFTGDIFFFRLFFVAKATKTRNSTNLHWFH